MRNKLNNFNGFTLTEIIITTFIIGAIAVFSIPNFNKAQEKELLRKAQLNMTVIHNALDIQQMRTGSYPDTTVISWDLDDLNNNLNLSITDTDFTYLFGGAAGDNLRATRNLPAADQYVLNDQVIPNPFPDGIRCTPPGKCP